MATQELTPKEKQALQEQEKTRPGRYYVPDVDIFEDEQSLWLSVDMPGVELANVDVELRDDVLTIEGRVSLKSYDRLTPLYTEYNVGHYFRRFTLPDSNRLNADQIRARITNGVLEIELPKSERAKVRRIPVGTQ
jgi:HSP20 family protein